jgi:hypothetical protein
MHVASNASVRWLVVGVALVAGCAPAARPRSSPVAPVRVRAFTEASPVRLLASAGPYLFAAADRGIDRWEVTSGAVLPLSVTQGVTGDRVLALAVDASVGWLWMVTDRGVAYYDVQRQTAAEVPPPPKALGLELGRSAQGEPRVISAAAAGGGLWIGDRRGLFYTDPAGHWTATGVTEPVTALHVADDGWLWIGTSAGLVGRDPSGVSYRYGPEHGLSITQVRDVTRGPGGGPIVVGAEASGRPRVALRRGDTWTSYRVSPELRWTAASSRGDDVVLLGEGGLYTLAARPPGVRRPLRRDGWRLLPVAGDVARALPLVLDRIDARLPAGAAALAVHGGEIFVGTRDVGVARIPVGGTAAVGWLRRGEMLTDATTLTVACRRANDCLLATGARRAWRWRGEAFESAGPEDQIVLAVVRSADGAIYGVHRPVDGQQLVVSRVDGGAWSAIAAIDTPGERPSVSFARFAPGGALWLGVRARDGLDDRPWGIAVVDVSSGDLLVHRPMLDRDEPMAQVVPVGAIDAAFRDGEMWMATGEGAVRITDDLTTLWTAADGLPSTHVRAVVVAGGAVMAATRAGIARYDGTRWTVPRELAFPVNDLAVARDGRLWLATTRGIAVYDGRRVRRVDVRRGLLENEISEVVVDDYGRLWARGARSLAMISP